jgi:glyoxylase I family protein
MMFEFYHNADAKLFNPSQYNPLSIHIAFVSPDINKTKEELVKAGATVVTDVNETPSGDQVLMLRDPWGLPIQFVERAEPMLTTTGLRFEHIAHNVKDAREVAKWYVSNYGMIALHESGAPNYGVFLADSAENMMIELYQNDQVPVINFSDVDFFSLHLASMSGDLAATKDKFVKAGATVAQDINKTPSGDEILVLRDPWGFPLQFVKRAVPMLK